ncbi:serine-rich adhesin for platelets-like isoform X2 [Planococcus citri]|uniref:serine-rich adhesin for platelets-like isoform X2 n=1 Tax=Planococcus citri TaxID=170843 RepID=UPI0031F835F2
MLFLSLISLITLSAACRATSEYLEETSQCIKNSSTFQYNATMSFEGCKTFRILLDKNDIFVDKTLLLKEIFKEHTYLTIFYLPHKFSKSINLEMIRMFAEIQLDSNFSILPPKDTFAYNFFTFGKILQENENSTEQVQLFERPLISRHMDLIDQHAAQYPAIYFDLSNLWGIQYKLSWSCFRDRVGHEFRRYSFLRSIMSTDECSRYNQLFDYFNHTELEWNTELDPAIDLPDSMIFLAQMVIKFFEKKPILFVDEYDYMLSQFIHKSYINDEESEQAMKFFTNFIATVFSRDDIWHRIILTGTLSMHKNLMSSLPGSKAIYHAFNNDLSHFFGFTEKDIRAQAKHFNIPENKLNQMREYYKGYQMGQHSPIYNPWSVMKFFKSKQLTNHWENEIKSKWFMNQIWGIDELGEQWLDFLSDRAEFPPRPFEEFAEPDLWTLRNTLGFCIGKDPSALSNLGFKEISQTLMYQVDMGYLTWSNYPSYDHETMFNLRIANYEIKNATYDKVRKTYQGYLSINITKADNATAKLNAYLFSRQREQFLDTLVGSFRVLFDKPKELLEDNSNSSKCEHNETNQFEGNATAIGENHSAVENESASKPNQINEGNSNSSKQKHNNTDKFEGDSTESNEILFFKKETASKLNHTKHIIDYIGLRLKYHHGYQLDHKINNGFIICKQNVSSMVVFNNNQSVDNTDVLNQIENYTHPWTELGSEASATSVTYIVIGVANETEICIRRYGEEPPIEITTRAPVEMTTKKTKPTKPRPTKAASKSPQTKKMKSGSKFNPNVTKSLNDKFRNQTRVTNSKIVMTKHTRNAKLQGNSTFATQHSSCTIPNFDGSTSVSQLNPDVAKSATESSTSKATDNTVKIEAIETQISDHKTESTKQSSRTNLNTTNPTTKSTEGTIRNDDATKSMTIIETQNHTTDPNKIQQQNDTNKTIIPTDAININRVHQTLPTEPISTESKSTLGVTKSSNETTVTQTLSSVTEESSLREITRITRSVPVEQSSSVAIATTESQSVSNSTSEQTTSSKGPITNKINVTKSETTTSPHTNFTTVTTIIPDLPQSSPSSSLSTDSASKSDSKSNPEVTKLSNESVTNEILSVAITMVSQSGSNSTSGQTSSLSGSITNKISVTNSKATSSPITTITPDQPPSSSPLSSSTDETSTSDSKSNLEVTQSSNKSVTNEIKVTDINKTPLQTNNLTTIINITPDPKLSTTSFAATVSKSNPQFTKSANQSFTKRQKVKNFNATTFVNKNWTKITKPKRPQGSFSTISMNRTSQPGSKIGSNFTRPSGKPFFNKTRVITTLRTTESLPTTTIEYWTRSRRTYTKGTPKSTTISRIKFLRMLFNYRG